MNLTVTQENLYLFLPSKVSRMADYLSEDKGCSIVEAVKRIYASDTYRQLEQENTKMWHYAPIALYSEYKEGDL